MIAPPAHLKGTIRRLLCLSVLLLPGAAFSAEPLPLLAYDKSGKEVMQVPVEGAGAGKQAWEFSGPNTQLFFKPSFPWPASAGQTAYLEITYLDQGYGRLTVTSKDAADKDVKGDKRIRGNLTDSGEWVTSIQRVEGAAKVGSAGMRITLDQNKGSVLKVAKVVLHDTPPENASFKFLLDEAWRRPYAGKSAPNIDNKTLKGKVMVGYQGWFRTPNDPYDRGWTHWGGIPDGHFSVDMWPDNSRYLPEHLDKAADVKTLSGKPGYLFSSGWPDVVKTHFAWMREHNIDGAFLQRFITDGSWPTTGRPEWVLGNVRAAANEEGRIWAIEYDVSGAKDNEVLEKISKDWKWLVDEFGINKDPAYAREGGKPVVFIWGLPFDSRGFSVESSNAVIDFFKNDPVYGGNHVIGGIPSNWRKQEAWQEHFKKYDAILCWMSKSYVEDVADFKKLGIDYWPHIWPGFSWANLKHIPTGSNQAYTPRDHGNNYRGIFTKMAEAGADRLFVGMFDEYDEGTAIIPMSDDPPPTPKRPGVIVKYSDSPHFGESQNMALKTEVKQLFDGNPPNKNIPAEGYSMRWEGTIMPPETGSYVLAIEGVAGDSTSLWLDDKRVLEIKKLGDGPEKTVTLDLTAGKPLIYRLEYSRLTTTGGEMKLVWQTPSAMVRKSVPPEVLVDAWGRFLTNEGDSPDLYLQLTSEARDLLKKNAAPSPNQQPQ